MLVYVGVILKRKIYNGNTDRSGKPTDQCERHALQKAQTITLKLLCTKTNTCHHLCAAEASNFKTCPEDLQQHMSTQQMGNRGKPTKAFLFDV